MKSCPRRLSCLRQAAQWPLLLAALIFLLFFSLPSFVKEPNTKPSRAAWAEGGSDLRKKTGVVNVNTFCSSSQLLTVTVTVALHVYDLPLPCQQLQETGSCLSSAPAALHELILHCSVPSDTDTVLLGQFQDATDKPLAPPRAVSPRHQNQQTTAVKMLTSEGPGKGGLLSTTSGQERNTTPVIRKTSPPVTTRIETKAKSSSQRVPELKAANFKSEPRWDFEDKYSLEVGGLQTTCPDSLKVKASRSSWLQHLFLPNITLFLDAKRFNQSEWDRLEHFPPPFGFMELNYSVVQKVVARFPPVPRQQLLLAGLPAGESGCITCAVVGNGGILNNSRVGRAIDSHDYVFRLSGAVVKGYEQDVGTRTSFYGFTAFSLSQSLLLLGRRGFQHVPLGKNVRYLHYLEGSRDFEWLEALFLNKTLVGKNFHWFRRRPQEAFREALQLDRYLLLHPDLLRYIKNRFLRSKTLDTVHWRIYRPTTGALVLFTALQLCDRVSAYGFITKGHERFSDHYYDKSWKRLIFYINHDFKLEQAVWKKLHDEGLLWLYERPEPPK
ncbi:PREDICTED: alpha-N-acetylgalactosaminide alpha-2,6-sialyltransferase 1 [Chrysochloris asiatica]|uniref:alpha-N-acetylgalactosaminide alpha-2,6-sialyltransferase n=1 Tax=Chrysochloris asiatica TaxID=185453 RepID=A0A9B0TZ93_CHRAS|nr:PREDICTED: alpha-N-acetylgalactosaminide alpha-2,6-sialyltransferase 1 [Chrysochloris asiatica]